MGSITDNNLDTTIVSDGRLTDLASIQNLILRSSFDGPSVKLSDVATIDIDYEKESIESRISGKPGISFTIFKSETADIITVDNHVKKITQTFIETYPELSIVKAKDFSKYLRNRLNVMISNGVIGLILVILVLTFFLNISMAFWVALGIPVAVLGVFFLMPAFNITINIISLLALIIVIGIIVDDGIIIAESIAKFKEQGLSKIDASVHGIQQVFLPVFTTILTTIIAFSPLFFMSGIMGKFIFQIPQVITIALIISLIEIVIALPSHIASGPDKPKSSTTPNWRHSLIQKSRNKYEQILHICLIRRYRLLLGFIAAFIGTIFFALNVMNFVLFPESNAVSFFIRADAPPGTPLEETSKLIMPIEAAILDLPNSELQSLTTRVGMSGRESSFLVEADNVSMIFVDLVPFTNRKRSARDIMKSIKEKTENTPGFDKITYQVEAGGPPVGQAVSIRVISDDNKLRETISDQVYEFTSGITGVQSLERTDTRSKSEAHIQFDYQALSDLNVNVADVHNTIRTAFNGFKAGSLKIDDEDINFVIELNDNEKQSFSTLTQLSVPNRTGQLIPLKHLLSITKKEGSATLIHIDGKRTTSIYGDIDKKRITSTKVMEQVKSKFSSDKINGAQLEFGGESQETNESVQNLIRSFVLALLGIFFLLILLFNSLFQPFMVLLTIPFGLIGVIIAFALHGQDLGFISMIGTIGLTGVVVNDSLVLVNHLNKKQALMTTKDSLINIVTLGSGDRFRPILITSCTTVAGLLPLAYGLGGSDPFIAPMALAIGYGLLFSTPLTLFLLPALYLIFNDISKQFKKITSTITTRYRS